MDKLGINPILIIAQIVNFAIVLFLLKKFLYKPILKVLDDRKQKAVETEAFHVKAKAEIDTVEAKKKEQFIEAKKEAEKIVNQAKIEAQKEKDDALEKLHKELSESRKKFERDMDSERKEMVKEMKKQSAELVTLISEKVIKDSLDDQKHKHLISEAIKELEKINLQ